MSVNITDISPQPALESIATYQTLGAAGDFTLDGSLASGGEVDLASYKVAHIVCIRSLADDSGLTFTVTGEDVTGTSISDTVHSHSK